MTRAHRAEAVGWDESEGEVFQERTSLELNETYPPPAVTPVTMPPLPILNRHVNYFFGSRVVWNIVFRA